MNKYIKEVYIIIRQKRPSLSNIEIDARSEAYVYCEIKNIDPDFYSKNYKILKS